MAHRRTAIVLFLGSALLCVAGCAGRTLMPTPNIIAMEGRGAFAQVPGHFRTAEFDIVYITDRLPEGRGPRGVRYGYDRSQSMAWGRATIEIGDDISWEELVKASIEPDRIGRLPVRVRRVVEDGRGVEHAAYGAEVGETIEFSEEAQREAQEAIAAFESLLSDRLALTDRKEVFVFVHGYNNTFEDAVLVMGELWHYFGREGVPIAYSWPAGSGGLLRGYTEDRESGEFTVYHLKEAIRAIAAHPEVRKIHFIAHSRGTDVFTAAFRELVIEHRAAGLSTRNDLKLGHVIIAAPDLDAEVFGQRFGRERLAPASETFTIYVSPTDRAIGLAQWLFRSPEGRIGRIDFSVFTSTARANIARLTSAAFVQAMLPRSPKDKNGHSYFHLHPAASSDVILLMRDGRAPGAEHGRPLHKVGDGFWQILPGYPDPEAVEQMRRRLDSPPASEGDWYGAAHPNDAIRGAPAVT